MVTHAQSRCQAVAPIPVIRRQCKRVVHRSRARGAWVQKRRGILQRDNRSEEASSSGSQCAGIVSDSRRRSWGVILPRPINLVDELEVGVFVFDGGKN